MSVQPAPDAATEQAGISNFPPLQTYSEEERMMRDSGQNMSEDAVLCGTEELNVVKKVV